MHHTVNLIAASALCTLITGCGEQNSQSQIPPTGVEEETVASEGIDEQPSPIAAAGSVDFAHSHDGWKGSGVIAGVGDSVTVLGEGLVNIGLPKPVEPRMFLWVRIGDDGEAFNLDTNADTFQAEREGEVQLTVRPAGYYWPDRKGSYPENFEAVPPYDLEASANVVLWTGDVEEGLSTLAEKDPEFVTAKASYGTAPILPEGFEYLWNLSRSRVFEAYQEGDRIGIRGLPTDDAGIVTKELDIPLTEETTISFDWLYENVPALGPETEAQFHDYLSIAVEFDNGQDITWLWSNHVDAGQSFTCPLPWWNERETHMVLQNGDEGLGDWHTHTRNLTADYEVMVGGQLPSRVTGVWFINSGPFGGHTGSAYFANAVISNGDQVTEVFE